MIFLLAALLGFVAYHFVPSASVCDGRIEWVYGQYTVTAVCQEPAFQVVCRINSRYTHGYGEETLCRTPRLRLAKIVDGSFQKKTRCAIEMGWLANYDPQKGCYCDYYSTEQHGWCVMTDEACQAMFGSDSMATESGLGYPDQCGCRDGPPLGAGSFQTACADGPDIE